MPGKNSRSSRARRPAEPRGALIALRPEFEERYIILHRNTFPGVLRQIRRSNVRDYSIFLLDGLLFSHFEYRGRNYESDMKAMAADPTTVDWWKLTDPMQQPLPDVPAGQWWMPMELLARLCPAPRTGRRYTRVALKAQLLPDTEGSLREVLARIPPAVLRAIAATGFRNVHLYLHGRELYLYADVAGKGMDRDALALHRSAQFSSWRGKIEPLLEPADNWRVMHEVFHTA
jgi:L-rhamnose mutarotase